MTSPNPLQFDGEMARKLEVLYRSRDVLRRRRLVREALGDVAAARVLDVGCGPGFYVAELLESVGPHGSVVGVDSSAAMLEMAARRCRGQANASFYPASATALPLDDASIDALLSVQVLEYVSDVPAALVEWRRVLRPGGRLVVWDVDWTTVSIHTTDAARTARMLAVWDEHLVHPALPRTLTGVLRNAGFQNISCDGHVFATNELDPDTYGGFLVSFLADFARGRDTVARDDVLAWEAEQRALGARGEFFFACVQFCFSAVSPL